MKSTIYDVKNSTMSRASSTFSLTLNPIVYLLTEKFYEISQRPQVPPQRAMIFPLMSLIFS